MDMADTHGVDTGYSYRTLTWTVVTERFKIFGDTTDTALHAAW